MGNQLFTRREVAEIFMVHPLTVRGWERKGIIKPSFHVSNRPRYTMEDIEQVPVKKEQYKLNPENK